jgi:predicted GTPase
MNLFRINTTDYPEQDLIIITDLLREDIVEVVNPIVNGERDGYEQYNNETLLSELVKRYPTNTVILAEEQEIII